MVRPIPGRRTFGQLLGDRLGYLGDVVDTSSLADLAAGAGFTGDDVAIAAAIAMAESGGNPRIYNPETAAGTPQGKGSYGLWQIYLKAHPEFAGWNLYDPQTNANAAYRVYQQQGWNAWSTFKSGAYRKYLTGVPGLPVPALSQPLTIDATTGQVVPDTTAPADVIASVVSPIPLSPNAIGLTILGIGAYFLATEIFGD